MEAQQQDCPICLEEQSPADLEHALQCKCGYNFCLTCIENLIKSSKDDYMEASDGNMHVKVFLNCPRCRSDLGSRIHDTVLLRKATLVSEKDNDDELSESERQWIVAIHEEQVQTAITEARRREAEFFGKTVKQDSWDVGIESHNADGNKSVSPPKRAIDTTLFQGLEYIMTQEEQLVVTDLMTSGLTNKLAAAAELLHSIVMRMQNGGTPPSVEPKKPPEHHRSSIYALIEESKLAILKADTAANVGVPETRPIGVRPTRVNQKAVLHKAIDDEIRQRNQFMGLHPLPVRMPKYVEFNLHVTENTSFLPLFGSRDSRPLTFCNDTWDGSVMDAFTKITITSNGDDVLVTKKSNESPGVLNVVHGVDDFTQQIDMDKERVLVASVSSQGGRQGVLKGDVVTHFNGEEFDGTAQDLDAAIQASADRSESGTFSLILNADRPVAEALKRRAMV